MQILRKHIFTILFIAILFTGLFFRLYHLSSNPAGFFCDEASIGYNAYEILTTGHDEYGVQFPIFFKAFGEYKTPVEIYSTVPSIFFFGLNEFSVRLVSVLYGMGCVILLYFLVIELWKDKGEAKQIALFSMLFLAISPWHIHMSRVALEGIIPYVFFVILGTFFFLKARHDGKYFLFSSIAFGIGMYTYFPSRVFIPLFVICLSIIYFRHLFIQSKYVIAALVLGIVFFIPFILVLHDNSIFARWNQVSIFSQPPQGQSIAQHIAINYVRHFSYGFLFSKGDAGMPGQFILRQSISGMGELYIIQLPLILLGILYSIKYKTKEAVVLLIWLALYPIGSMFTTSESPSATRSIIGVIPFAILSGIGAYAILTIVKKFFGKDYGELFFWALFDLIVISAYIYTRAYFVQYPLSSSGYWGWQYGPRPVIAYFVTKEHQYDQLFMEGQFNAPYIFFNFYSPNDCKNCFVGTPKDNLDRAKKQLFAVTPDYLQANPSTPFILQKTIYYPNGSPAFLIGTLASYEK